uniref:Putative polyprotein n=1 Tax=Albugo laibachii Nc14 TaxID=890382 RepID=F0WZX7_9STRA|nr:putative polyprotein [Albugo laibachii Nc14]|eukprot:CCA27058.1 putative polyprotein [Albugo laibachii Nc14]
MARGMFFACGLPLYFWGETVEYAAYIPNGSPSHANTNRASPLEVLTGKVPDLSSFVAFGSLSTVYRDPRKNSLQPRAQVGIFIRKCDERKEFRVFLKKDRLIIVTQHIKNIESLNEAHNSHLQRGMEFDVGNGTAASEGDDTMTSSPAFSAEQVAHNKRKKTWQRPRHVTRSTTRPPVTDGQQKEIAQEMVNHIVERDPLNYGEVRKSSKALEWSKAMEEEISALLRLEVFEVIKRPRDSKEVQSKWVFKTKTSAEARVERFKARLVACENEKKLGVDFFITFAMVMNMSTVKIVLALAVILGVPAQYGDVPNAYAQADKESGMDIFLHVPSKMAFIIHEIQKFGAKNPGELILRLKKKKLYGLKQAGRLWSKLLHEYLSEAGFEQCITDMCLYYKVIDENIIVVGVYVDDLLVTSTRADLIQDFFCNLSSLSIKQLGEVRKFLGMRVNSIESRGYVLDQEEAIDEILRDAEEFGQNRAHADW